jgi:type II secretory pathway component PulF
MRAHFLGMLAMFMRRGLPVETALATLGTLHSGSYHERLARRVYARIHHGADLADALEQVCIVTRQQAVAMRLAQARGVADVLLKELAEQGTFFEKRFLQTVVLMLYPLLLGSVLCAYTSFITVFIVPRFQVMARDMELGTAFRDFSWLASAAATVLLAWGVIALTLQHRRAGLRLWWHVPFLGEHLRLYEQAAFARNLALMIRAGGSIEEAIPAIASEHRGGALQRWLAGVSVALQNGVATVTAFRAHGSWRPELLWAIEAVTHGVRPELCLNEVAQVLEEKATARLNNLHRLVTPAAVIFAACGIGAMGYGFFEVFSMLETAMFT